jgi:hypothetical protein
MNAFKVLKASREMVCLAALLTTTCCFAQSDPGPRGGAAGAGAPIGVSHLANWIFSPTTVYRSFLRWRLSRMGWVRDSIWILAGVATFSRRWEEAARR